MKQTIRKSERRQRTHGDWAGLPIVYHSAVEKAYGWWSAEVGLEPQRLRQLTEQAIRTRPDEARGPEPWYRANERHGDIYELALESCVMYFSVEAAAIVVRGYSWDVPEERRGYSDGGGIYT